MNRLLNKECNLKEISPLALAFIGDGVFDLLVREDLVCRKKEPVNTLNRLKVENVCCKSQAKAVNNILDKLSDEELLIYKRGRNAKTSCTPKNASVSEYHAATGLESLIGYLYLKGDINRLREIYNLISNL